MPICEPEQERRTDRRTRETKDVRLRIAMAELSVVARAWARAFQKVLEIEAEP